MNIGLDSVERARGAAFGPFGDIDLPARFGELQTEWAAVRQRCGLLDARFRGLLRVTGDDRVGFLQGMLSNDVAILKPGGGTYAALLTQQGKLVADLRVYVLENEIWLDVPAARVAAVREDLERYVVADDVEFVDDLSWTPLLAVEGPQAARVLASVTGETCEGGAPFTHRSSTFDGIPVRVAASQHAGEMGYLFLGRPDDGGDLWLRCLAAGAEPVGLEALDVLRVEAGIPWYGRDMDESTLISEVGLETAISYKKGCYLGQEVVERVAARGQVQRKLVGLRCERTALPPAGSKLIHDGKEGGWITSAVWSPACQSVIALGYARRGCWDEGSEMQVDFGEAARARVVPLPFYGGALRRE